MSSGRDCDRMSDFGGCGLAAGSDLPVASPPVLVFYAAENETQAEVKQRRPREARRVGDRVVGRSGHRAPARVGPSRKVEAPKSEHSSTTVGTAEVSLKNDNLAYDPLGWIRSWQRAQSMHRLKLG